MTDKREKPLGLDKPFDEVLERFIGTDPAELPENVKLRQKRGRRSDPQVLMTTPPTRKPGTSALTYPLAGAPVSADVLDPAEADTIVCLDEHHRASPRRKAVAFRETVCDSSNANRVEP